MTGTLNRNILIVEDDAIVIEALRLALQGERVKIFTAIDFTSALVIMNNNDIELVVSDIMLCSSDIDDPANGLNLLYYIKKHFKKTHVIMLSSSEPGVILAKSMDADEAFLKGDELPIVNIVVKAYLAISQEKI